MGSDDSSQLPIIVMDNTTRADGFVLELSILVCLPILLIESKFNSQKKANPKLWKAAIEL